jgi:hypothetical protein
MRALEIRQAVALQAEEVYPEALRLAKLVRSDFQGQREEGAGRGQLRQLEATICASDTVAGVLSYVKRQTARLKPWRESGLGKELLRWIEEDLPSHLDGIRRRLADQRAEPLTEAETLAVRLTVIQEYARALVSQVEYLRVVEAGGPL